MIRSEVAFSVDLGGSSRQMKNLKIEAEKGFRRTLFEPELVDPNVEINFVKDSEGRQRCWRVQL